MKTLQFLFVSIFVMLMLVFATISVFAQQASSIPHDIYMNARIQKIQKPDSIVTKTAFEILTVQILDTKEKGKIVQLTYDPQINPGISLYQGEGIIIAQTATNTANSIGDSKYYFVDFNRQVPVVLLIFAFLGLIIFIAGWKGIGGIVGLIISLCIIFLYIVPQILKGADPLMTCMLGSVAILFLTTYIAHGFSRQTTIALISTLFALVITFFLSKFVIHLTLLTGYGDPEAADLHFGLSTLIDIKGLLLGGIILATLGALNDITVTQSVAIFSLHRTNPSFSFRQLAEHGITIGKEHAISLINTLVLAYAGSALSIFIFFLYNPNNQPLWVILNSEVLNEEVMRTIAGTAGLLLSVPIVTILASLAYDKRVIQSFKDLLILLY